MVGLTDRAKEALGKILERANTADPAFGLRLAANSSGDVGLVLDIEEDGDQVVLHAGQKVLLIGKELCDILEGITIDLIEDGAESNLVLWKQG